MGSQHVPIARCGSGTSSIAPKLSATWQAHLLKLHAAGEHTIAELAELFEVSRPTVYRTLERQPAQSNTSSNGTALPPD